VRRIEDTVTWKGLERNAGERRDIKKDMTGIPWFFSVFP
jgi:hypothetical protein